MSHKAGFVNIIGSPNVGKSTLMNALVGERVSVINSKAQTTRHRIMGIVSGEDFQIVYSDTPGVLQPAYKMQESMMETVNDAFRDADIFLLVTDHEEETTAVPEIVEKLKRQKKPVFVVVNKADLCSQEEIGKRLDHWKEMIPKAKVFAASALKKYNLNFLLEYILKDLPEHPAYFDKEEYTDKSMRFLVSEIIREKILRLYEKEIPYSTEVVVESYKEENNLIRIQATIYVSRDSQKGIVIGHEGGKLKKVGTLARIEIEELTGTKVFLQLHVKVQKNWRDDERMLKNFGYKK